MKFAPVDEQIAILTREGCPFCAQAKKMLDEAGLEYAEVALPHTVRSKVLGAIARAQTVPQVFVNGELGLQIPGSDGLPGSVTAVAVRDGRIVALYGVVNPEKLGRLRRSPDR